MPIGITRRVEALEKRIVSASVIVIFDCEACGQSLPLDDPDSLCSTHPHLAVPTGATIIRVRFIVLSQR